MATIDYIINATQAFAYGFFCIKYADEKKLMHSLSLAVLLFAIITFFNLHTAYEGIFSFAYSAIIFIYLSVFTRNSKLDNLFVALFMNLLISIGNQLAFLLFRIFLHFSLADILTNDLLRYAAAYLSTFIFLLVMIALIKVRKKYENIFTKYTSIILVICAISNYIVIVLEKILFSGLYTENELEIIVSVLSVLFISCMAVYLLFTEKEESIKHQNNLILSQQLLLMKNRLNDYQKNNQKLSVIRHDLKNNLMIINELLNNGEIKKAQTLISRLSENSSLINVVPITGLISLDCVLSSKSAQASESNIKFTTAINKAGLESFDEFDLAVLLANCLDNAIENISTQNRSIHVFISEKNKMLRIIITNTVDSNILAYNPELKSTKADIESHGYGIESMKLIVQKYDGDISFHQEENEFKVLITLPLH